MSALQDEIKDTHRIELAGDFLLIALKYRLLHQPLLPLIGPRIL